MVPKKKVEWDLLMEALLEVGIGAKSIQEILGPFVGKRVVSRDNKRSVTVARIMGDKAYLDVDVVLEKPAEFVQFRIHAKEEADG